jgi:exonuclease III
MTSTLPSHWLTTWIKKEDPTICCLQNTHLIDRRKCWHWVKGWKKICQANDPQKPAGVAIFISDNADSKSKLVRWDKEGHFILIKGAIHEEEITIVNLPVPNVGISNFIKHTLQNIKTQIDPNTVVVGSFNTPLSPIDRSSRKKNSTKKL